MMLHLIAIILSTLCLLAALGFTLVPIVPGTLFVIPGVLVYGWLVSFAPFGKSFIIGQLVLMVIVFLADNVAQLFGIKKLGGSKAGIWGATIGMFALPLLLSGLGPLAVIFGPLAGAVIGAMIGETLNRRSTGDVVKVGFGAALSFLGGTFFKFLLVLVQVIWFYMAIF